MINRVDTLAFYESYDGITISGEAIYTVTPLIESWVGVPPPVYFGRCCCDSCLRQNKGENFHLKVEHIKKGAAMVAHLVGTDKLEIKKLYRASVGE